MLPQYSHMSNCHMTHACVQMDSEIMSFLTEGDVARHKDTPLPPYLMERSGHAPATTLTADESKEPFKLMWPTTQMHGVRVREVGRGPTDADAMLADAVSRRIGQSGRFAVLPVDARKHIYTPPVSFNRPTNPHNRSR